jgi:hypothetical protein
MQLICFIQKEFGTMKIEMFRQLIISSLFSVLFSASTNANLIVNGGFEENSSDAVVLNPVIIWYPSSAMPGWDGSNIELWGSYGIPSKEGSFHAELNATNTGQPANPGPWSIFQTFATTAGQSYDLTFAYSGSASSTDPQESFEVSVDGLYSLVADHSVGVWSIYSNSFIADGDSATLMFTSVTPANSYSGNLLNDIIVTASPDPGPVGLPEPGSLALLALGLFGLAAGRRKA